MELKWIAEKACWKFINNEKPAHEIFFSPEEISFIGHALERVGWKSNIDIEIDNNYDNIDFENMSRDEFMDLCMDELESKWECGMLNNEPDYQEIVFDVAQENGIWRD